MTLPVHTRMLLVAGGTGGHIIPAVAFGNWLKARQKGVEVDYMSGSRPLELEIYRQSGIEPFALDIMGSPMGAPKGEKISRWRDLIRSITQAKRIIAPAAEKRYDLCLLFGGYVSVPALWIARRYGLRLLVHEQNARAGVVTRIASALGVAVASGWRVCDPLVAGKFTCTGTPIRRIEITDRDKAWHALGLSGEVPDGPIAVVTTGSIGSAAVGEAVGKLAQEAHRKSWCFLVVDADVREPVRGGANLFRIPRVWDIGNLYSLADILVTRAGASTLAEVEALGIPALVIPWRGAAKDHQMLNANQLHGADSVAIWDERGGDIDELSHKVDELGISRLSKKGVLGKRMYNAFENICGRLWRLAAGIMKGEVHVGGR